MNISAFAQVKLPSVISDNMILQQNKDIKIWGSASWGETIYIDFLDKTYSCSADKDGKWMVTIPPQKAGGPYTMTIKASNTITLKDILIGEVWLCSGQSNMELPIRRVEWIYPGVKEQANNPNVRYMVTPYNFPFSGPADDVKNLKWQKVSPENVGEMSSLAYFYAIELQERLNVPVGVIVSALGGSKIQSWLKEEDLKVLDQEAFNELQPIKSDSLVNAITLQDRKNQNDWYAEISNNDLGNKEHWEKLTDFTDWQQATVPERWSNFAGKIDPGTSMWFAKKVTLTKEQAENAKMLIMGVIVDSDDFYINGQKVGSTGYQYPPRRYAIKQGILKEGENIIVGRIISDWGNGEFVKGKDYCITYNENDTLRIDGNDWLYKQGASINRKKPSETVFRWKPAGLYNGMIAPFTNLNFAGVLWYQGESNSGEAVRYYDLLSGLIKSWRREFNNPNMPFIICQLPLFMGQRNEPSDGDWAKMRQSQFLAAKNQANCGLVCTIEFGEHNDIHPLRKKESAIRCANQAMIVAYKKNAPQNTLVKSMKIKNDLVTITFTQNINTNFDKNIFNKVFAIKGENQKYQWAEIVSVADNKIIIKSQGINTPNSVRYLWADNPGQNYIYDINGLPILPFEKNK